MENIYQEDLEKAFNRLFMKSMELYTKGTLRQYGLDNEAALEIVSNLTGLTKDSLVSLKQCRDEMLSEKVEDSFDTLHNVLGSGRAR